MDLCLEVLADKLNDGQIEGMVINVFPAEQFGHQVDGVWQHNDVISAPRSGFIWLTDVPVGFDLEDLKETLLEADEDLTDPENPISRDRRRLDVRLDNAAKPSFKEGRQINLTWNDFPVWNRIDNRPAIKNVELRRVVRRVGRG